MCCWRILNAAQDLINLTAKVETRVLLMREPKHVCFLAHTVELYGASRSLLALIDHLTTCGIHSSVLIPRSGALTLELTKRGIPYTTCSINLSHTEEGRLQRDRALLTRIRTGLRIGRYLLKELISLKGVVKAASQYKPDIIYSNSSVIIVGQLVADVLRLPHIWHLREFGLEDYGLSPRSGQYIYGALLRRASHCIAVSRSLRLHFGKYGISKRITVIYNGVIPHSRLRRIEPKNLRRNSNTHIFGIVGGLHETKGQQVAIEAISLLRQRFSHVQLALVGDGSSEHTQKLKDLAEALGVSELISFRGFVDDPLNVICEFDALLMCSRSEAMGRVVAEAMAVGRVVIGFAGGATAELIQNNWNGLLYTGGPKALADCMARVILEPQLVERLQQNALAFAKQHFTVEQYGARVLRVISAALAPTGMVARI